MGNPEVSDHCPARSRFEQDIVRFDITMYYAASVGVCECPRDFAQYACGVSGWERSLCSKLLSQRFAFDIAHYEEDESICFAYAMDRNDVRVRQSGCGSRFLEESLARSRQSSEVRGEDLDCDIAIELDFAGEIDDSHATAADFPLE
jgi:hypothetical protein